MAMDANGVVRCCAGCCVVPGVVWHIVGLRVDGGRGSRLATTIR